MRLLTVRAHLQGHLHTTNRARERINSQAQALGIERLKVRTIRSVRNLNTLIYLSMNVHALNPARSINKAILPIS